MKGGPVVTYVDTMIERYRTVKNGGHRRRRDRETHKEEVQDIEGGGNTQLFDYLANLAQAPDPNSWSGSSRASCALHGGDEAVVVGGRGWKRTIPRGSQNHTTEHNEKRHAEW